MPKITPTISYTPAMTGVDPRPAPSWSMNGS